MVHQKTPFNYKILVLWGIHRKEKETREKEEVGGLKNIFYKGQEKSGLEGAKRKRKRSLVFKG